MDSDFRKICQVCDELRIDHDLSAADWIQLETVRDILRPFADAVKRLEGEQYCTISELYPLIFALQERLNEVRYG